MKPCLRDIADALGISVSQVSRALSNKYGVAPELRDAVLAEARKRDYRNESGRHFRKVAVVFQSTDEKDVARMEKFRGRLKRKKYRLLFLFPDGIDFLDSYRVDMVIAFELPPSDREALFRKCRALQLPISDYSESSMQKHQEK